MAPRFIKSGLLATLLIGLCLSAFYCKSPNQSTALAGLHSEWRNVYDTTAHYVGMNTCRNCHQSVYESFIQTGMGQSFAPATRSKSAADFSPEHALVYDKDKDFYYKPYFNGDSMYIMEYRLQGKDTIHKRIETVNYIIGSGQHTNSHIYNSGGYLYQAPITFYTQKHRWDLAPGFEKGSSFRFERMIQLECMSCHNGYPEFIPGSENKYQSLKNGIDCERCHGPGSIHVAEKTSGTIVDTSKGPDYSIVNPRRLSTELQNNVCQRCHLQGIGVLNEGKNYFDFRPGMHLSEVENVFMPEYQGAQDKMIMASHVERMKKSECYIRSGQMSCITCHNPHVSVKFTPRTQYLNACQSCHQDPGHASGNTAKNFGFCTETPANRAAKKNDCVTCHMPHNGSIDIPHVAVTDHFIRKRPLADAEKDRITAFLGMKCFNNDHVDAITTARAYMEFYERFTQSKALLDSSLSYLNRQTPQEASQRMNQDYIRCYFLLENYPQVISYANSLKPAQLNDGWTCYRIGEALVKSNRQAEALPWYERAVTNLPYALDFQNKYGSCLLSLNRLDEAEKTFRFILAENPKYSLAAGNLGFTYMQKGQPSMAYEYLSRAIALDPDREQTLINLAVYLHGSGDLRRCQQVLEQVLKRHPDNEQATAMLEDLKKSRN